MTSGFGPFTEYERYEFDLRGFVVRRGALSPEEVAELHVCIDNLRLPTPGESIGSQRFSDMLTEAEPFRRLLDHQAVFDAVIELCGPYARMDHCYGIVMSPGTEGLGLHGGGTPHDPAQFYAVHKNQMFNGLIAAQWALVDHHVGSGGFCCIPGSHRANFALPDPYDPSWVHEVALHAGDLVFFTEALTHGTSPWTATFQRRSLFYKYAPGHLAWGRNYERELADPALHSLLTDRQRRLLQPPAVYPHDPLIDTPAEPFRYPRARR